jgi:acetyl-CoA acetyltransferase
VLEDVVVAGVGIHPFGRFDAGYRDLGAQATLEALNDAHLRVADLDRIFVANVGAEMAKGQSIMERLGRPGIPIYNVEAACASSASAIGLAGELIHHGAARIVLCLGVEKAPRGFIASSGFEQWQLDSGLGVNPIYFALEAQRLLGTTDASIEDLADVSVKNHEHAVDNPNAMYRKSVTREEVLQSPLVAPPLTLYMLCAPNEGAAAAILMHRDEARRRGIDDSVALRSVTLVSRGPDDWGVPAPSLQSDQRTSVIARAARLAYEEAGVAPDDLDVIECQDTDSASELFVYRDLGLCAPGDEAKLLRSGQTTLRGSRPVNPSGGLLARGEPLGATGLGQLHELVQQLRGRCGRRQVTGARLGLGQVRGAGNTAAVVVVSR